MSLSLPIGILGQVWFLIVSIPDLCTLTYFEHFAGQARFILDQIKCLLEYAINEAMIAILVGL